MWFLEHQYLIIVEGLNPMDYDEVVSDFCIYSWQGVMKQWLESLNSNII